MTIARTTALNSAARKPVEGFTLIELMIVIAIIAIILTLAVPVYSNYTIRAKIGEALSVAAAAKTAVASTCHENVALTGLSNARSGYSFEPSTWVESLEISGDCSAPVVTITTRNTGAPTDPVLFLTGNFVLGTGSISWVCSTDAANFMVPAECRS